MGFKIPKNTDKYFWTQHAIYKLRQYGLSAQRAVRVINNPQRKEEGIVPKTIAVMQPASTRVDRSSTRGGPAKKIWSQEIWVMYTSAKGGKVKSSKLKVQSAFENLISSKLKTDQLKIISVWRYPGVSPKRNPIPEEILREIEELK